MNKKELTKYINELPELEKLVLTLKFGLDGYEPLNNRQIAKKLKIPLTGISSIENSAIQTIRIRHVDIITKFDLNDIFPNLIIFLIILSPIILITIFLSL